MPQHIRMIPNRPPRRQQGWTLLELGMVIAAGLVIAGLGLFLLWYIYSDTKVTEAQNNLNMMQSKLRKQYYQHGDFTGLTETVAAGVGIFPEKYISGTTVVNEYGGQVKLQPVAHPTTTAANMAYEASTANIPEYDCTQLVTGIAPSFLKIEVGGTVVKQPGGKVDLAQLGTACKSGASSGGTVTIKVTGAK